MSVKRRAVWFSDQEWAVIRDRATFEGLTISRYIQRTMTSGIDHDPRATPRQTRVFHVPNEPYPAPASEAQASRDAILRRINKGG